MAWRTTRRFSTNAPYNFDFHTASDHSRTAARPTGDVARARGPSTRYTSPSSLSVNCLSLKSSRNQPADAQLQKQASSDRAS